MTLHTIALALLAALAFTLPWEKSVTFAGIGTVARAVGILAFVAGLYTSCAHIGIVGLISPCSCLRPRSVVCSDLVLELRPASDRHRSHHLCPTACHGLAGLECLSFGS